MRAFRENTAIIEIERQSASECAYCAYPVLAQDGGRTGVVVCPECGKPNSGTILQLDDAGRRFARFATGGSVGFGLVLILCSCIVPTDGFIRSVLILQLHRRPLVIVFAWSCAACYAILATTNLLYYFLAVTAGWIPQRSLPSTIGSISPWRFLCLTKLAGSTQPTATAAMGISLLIGAVIVGLIRPRLHQDSSKSMRAFAAVSIFLSGAIITASLILAVGCFRALIRTYDMHRPGFDDPFEIIVFIVASPGVDMISTLAMVAWIALWMFRYRRM